MQESLIDWLNYIGDIHSSAIDLGLQRIEPLAQKLNITHFRCSVITVGGTNGKGSVIKTLESIYRTAGYRVAAYTSPHLLDFNERLVINGKPIDDAALITAFEKVEIVREQQSLSFFEFTTLAILLICRDLKLDLLLLEIGLGGRLDAVNIVNSDLAIVTNVDLDHTQWLGDTREKIGFEKAGIYRRNKPAICGDANPPQSLLNFAAENQVKLFCFERDYSFRENAFNWAWHGPDKSFHDLPFPRLKLQNVATSIMAIELLGLPVSLSALQEGIQQAHLPGRYEISQTKCKLIYDVAHNPQGANYLAERLAAEPRLGQRYAVVGMLKDKDIAETVRPLIPHIDSWFVATLNEERGAQAALLTSHLTANSVGSCYNFNTVAAAMQKVFELCRAEDIVLIFGSFHTVADAKRFMQKGAP